MALELYYTSSPRGLRPGTSGLCTVAMTRTMSAALAARLESLCGYRPPSEGTPIEQWPVALSHWIIDVGGVERHILASVRPVRPDHTMRSNTLAHFAVLHPSELDPAGAAWMIAQPETVANSWSGEPRLLDAERAMPKGGPLGVRRCSAWHATAGDAGWAGVLANAAVLDPSRPTTVIYPAGVRVIDLVAEAMSLVPPAHRWRVTFTTYFTQPIAGLRCTWRFCLDGSSAATAARQGGGLVIDVCAPQQCTRSGAFIDAARSGKEPVLQSPSDAGQRRPQSEQVASSAARSVLAAGAAQTDEEPGHSRRVPMRRPVGVDEPVRAQTPGSRTALAAAVVVSIALLAVVAVLAVIMRSMGTQSAELEARLAEMQERISTLEVSEAELSRLTAERDRLQGELGSANEALRTLKSATSAVQPESGAPQQPAPAPSPADPGSESPDVRDSQQPAASEAAPVDSEIGPALVVKPGASTRRAGIAFKNAAASGSVEMTEDAIGEIRLPDLLSVADKDEYIAWPAATECGATSIWVTPSHALAQCGFVLSTASTLALEGIGEDRVDLARVDLSHKGPKWTWLRGSVPKAKQMLASHGLRLPEDWDSILRQLTLTVTCADSRQRTAMMRAPRLLAWTLRGKQTGRMEVSVPAVFAQSPVLTRGDQRAPITSVQRAAALPAGQAGSVSAFIASPKQRAGVATIALEWIPSDEEVLARQRIEDLARAIDEERSVNSVWMTASWLSAWEGTGARAGQPKPEERSVAVAQFRTWSEDRVNALATKAERTAFLEQSDATRWSKFSAWILESKLTPMRNELVRLKHECDAQWAPLLASVEGTVVAICPDDQSPPLARVVLALECKMPVMPDFDRPHSSGGAR